MRLLKTLEKSSPPKIKVVYFSRSTPPQFYRFSDLFHRLFEVKQFPYFLWLYRSTDT